MGVVSMFVVWPGLMPSSLTRSTTTVVRLLAAASSRLTGLIPMPFACVFAAVSKLLSAVENWLFKPYRFVCTLELSSTFDSCASILSLINLHVFTMLCIVTNTSDSLVDLVGRPLKSSLFKPVSQIPTSPSVISCQWLVDTLSHDHVISHRPWLAE